MLILRRKPGESIKIGDDITIMMTKSDSHAAWIGIEAPKEIHIVRTELLDEPEEEEA